MRIGVDVRCLMDGGRTGVEEYTLGVLRAMLALNEEDTFVLFANSQKPTHLPAFASPRVELRAFAYPNKLFNASLRILRRPRLDRLLGDVAVLFVPSVRLVPVSATCPVVATFHDLSFVRHPAYFSRQRRTWHILMEPRRLARAARTIIAVSRATARDVETLYGISPERVRVVYSGIGDQMRPLLRESEGALFARARYKLPPRFLLFLGTLEPRKNLLGLLDAYTAARRSGVEHHLVLAGVRGWIGEEFFDRVRKNPYTRDIHFTGFVDDADKPALYALADAFVYPSFYEGFGFPPLEALACGTPVVTSYNAAIPEVAGAWATLVNPHDSSELSAVLLEHLSSPQRVPEEVSAAVRSAYTWRRAGGETLAILRAAAQGEYPSNNTHEDWH